MEIEKSIEYGYMTEEIKEFLGESLTQEEREGIGAVGNFVKQKNGETYLLSQGDIINKYVDGSITISSKYH